MAESQAWWAAPRGQWKSLDQAGYVLVDRLAGPGLYSPEGLLHGYPPAHPGRPSQALPASRNPWASSCPAQELSLPALDTTPAPSQLTSKALRPNIELMMLARELWAELVNCRAKRVLAFPAQEEGTCSVILTKKPSKVRTGPHSHLHVVVIMWWCLATLHPPHPTGTGHLHDTARVPCPYWKEG